MNRLTPFFLGIFFLFSSLAHAQWTTSGSNVWLMGNAGIGTQTPNLPLDLVASNFGPIVSLRTTNANNSWVQIGNANATMNLGVGLTTQAPYIWSGNGSFFIGSDGLPTLFVQGMSNGNVGIGVTDTKGYKLAVNGDAVFTKVVVKAASANFPDYVFNDDYKLRPLKEVAAYIQANRHLPEVPSAAEVEKSGVDVGQNQSALLKKVEELTLYVIELEKTMDKQQKELSELRSLVKPKK